MSVVLYACENWTLRKRDKNALLAFEMTTESNDQGNQVKSGNYEEHRIQN